MQSHGASASPLHQQNSFRFIQLAQLHLDDLVECGLHAPADELSFHRQLSVPTIDQHAELHPLWASMTEQRVHGSTGRPPGVENIINQDNVLSRNRDPNLALLHHRLWADSGKVVTVQSDVERANRYRSLLNALDHGSQALGYENSAPPASHQTKVSSPVIFLDNFVGKS